MIPDDAPSGAGSFEGALVEKIDEIRAKGYAAGLEAAAKWHDKLVKFMEEEPCCDSTRAAARRHRKCAKAIRALGKEGA